MEVRLDLASLARKAQVAVRVVGLNVHPWPSDRHLALEYPVSRLPRYGAKVPPHPTIAALLESKRDEFAATLGEMAERQDLLKAIPSAETQPLTPYWNNGWFPPLDGAALMHFILKYQPAKFMEIGSGNSTIFAKHAIRHGALSTKITSIDPQPRRGIDDLCDTIIRQRLQDLDLAMFDDLAAGDVLFFDGSHIVFADSDVTVFFLEVLPRLAKGVIVQIHDIFWPMDYPADRGARYYSEQYMLGMLLIYAPQRFDTLLANAFISSDAELGKMAAELTTGDKVYGHYGVSCWLRVS